MTYQGKLVALLLASASAIGISGARADDKPIVNLQTADAGTATQAPQAPEILSVTTEDQGGTQGGSASSNVGTIDVQGAGQALGSGYIVPEDGPKGRSTVTHEGINNLLPSANPFQVISILPGVNQFQDDAVGLSGGTIRVRGLVAAQMGFTINGAPVNDSGNFAIYPQEYVDAENINQIWVTQGSTDIDAPHVGASGGNIGIVTRAPLDTFNIMADAAGGETGYARGFVSLDTGWIGDFKGFISFSRADADKWRGLGSDRRDHSDGNLLWQFLPHSSVGLIWLFNDAFDYEYRGYTNSLISGSNDNGSADTALQAFDILGRKFDNDTFWGTSSAYPINLYGPSSSAGCATNPSPKCTVVDPNFPAYGTTNITNNYTTNLNPFRNAVVTAPLHIQITDDLRWETNGYLWWGSGGGSVGTTLNAGQYYNGYQVPSVYGAPKGDSVLLYRSSVTRTFRPGIESKLVYDWDNWTFMGGIWAEHAEHRQTAPFSTVSASDAPCDPWLTVYDSCWVVGPGAASSAHPIEYRDFKTVSVGQSAYVEIQGRFFDDALKLNVGLSDRDIHRSMYDYLPVCAVNAAYCTTAYGGPSLATILASTTWTQSSAYKYFGGNYAAMQAFAANPHANWNAALPEFNGTFDLDPTDQLFGGLASGYRTPSNFNFSTFNSTSAPTVLEITDIKPEFDWTYEAGYRFHGDFLTASVTAFFDNLHDYQASEQLDAIDYTTANIGSVKIYGIEAEAGTKPWHGFTFYGSATLQNSAMGSDLSADNCSSSNSTATYPVTGCTSAQNTAGITLYVHTKGKQLVDTPNWLASGSIGYAEDGFFANVTPHCYGQRATALLNDEYVPANCTVDASVGYRFTQIWGSMKDATFQLYVLNMFDSEYLGEITTQAQTNAKTAVGYSPSAPGARFTIPGQSYTAYPGAPLFVGVKFSVNVGD
jgi:iron complex outermembrane recepter protein